MKVHFLLPAISLILAACGVDSSRTAGLPTDAPAPGSAPVGEDLETAPCTVLTADMVSEATGAPAERLRQLDVAGLCRYTWDGATAEARFTVLPSAAEARERFERTYRGLTPDERARGQAALDDELDRRRQARELGDRQAATAEGIGGTIGDLAEATEYEPIHGIGDQAVYDGTIHVIDMGGPSVVRTAESRLHFRSGNLIATVAADLFDPGRDLDARRAGPPAEVRERNREATLALGRVVLERLAAAGDAR